MAHLDPVNNNVAPHTKRDALGIHMQIDGGMAYGEMSSMIDGWRTTLPETEVFDRLRDQSLTAAWAMNGEGKIPSRVASNTHRFTQCRRRRLWLGYGQQP